VFEVIYAALSVSSTWWRRLPVAFFGRWYFIVAVPFIHLFTRRVYVGLQIASVALLGLGMPPVFVYLAPLG
jgi:hypothetical protein